MATELPTKLDSCKSRLIKHGYYYIGDGNQNNAFVSLVIKVLSGREKKLLKKISEKIIDVLQVALKDSLTKLNLQISVSMEDLLLIYFKISELTK